MISPALLLCRGRRASSLLAMVIIVAITIVLSLTMIKPVVPSDADVGEASGGYAAASAYGPIDEDISAPEEKQHAEEDGSFSSSSSPPRHFSFTSTVCWLTLLQQQAIPILALMCVHWVSWQLYVRNR